MTQHACGPDWPPPDEIGGLAGHTLPPTLPMPGLQDKEQMVRSVDPRRETLRAIQRRIDAAVLFGTHAAEPILASGVTAAQHRPNTWAQATRSNYLHPDTCKQGAVHTWSAAPKPARNDDSPLPGIGERLKVRAAGVNGHLDRYSMNQSTNRGIPSSSGVIGR